MDNKINEVKMVPVASVEVLVQGYIRIIKWIIIAITVIVVALFAYLTIQYVIPEEVVETQSIQAEQEGNGIYLLGGGDVSYGAESNNPQN